MVQRLELSPPLLSLALYKPLSTPRLLLEISSSPTPSTSLGVPPTLQGLSSCSVLLGPSFVPGSQIFDQVSPALSPWHC